jgi:hypothetical protein
MPAVPPATALALVLSVLLSFSSPPQALTTIDLDTEDCQAGLPPTGSHVEKLTPEAGAQGEPFDTAGRRG